MLSSSVPARASRRNQSMECLRLIASFFVVFAHLPFPGDFGHAMNCLARFSVPFFFAISGYFSYGVDSRRLGKRIRSMLVLMAAAFGLELFWNCLLIELQGGSSIGFLRAMIPTATELLEFFFLCLNPLRDSLWYLPAALEVLCILWVYVRFFGKDPVDYRPLYIVGFCLLIGNLTMGTLGQTTGTTASVFLIRNGLFFGVPMFTMGLFLRQHGQRILENFALNTGKLILLILAGFMISLAEWFCFGICDVMVGTTCSTMGLVLLTSMHPNLTDKPLLSGAIATFGTLSTVIYVVHPLFIDIYNNYLQPLFGQHAAMTWMAPLLVIAMSLITAVIWDRFLALFRKIRKA